MHNIIIQVSDVHFRELVSSESEAIVPEMHRLYSDSTTRVR